MVGARVAVGRTGVIATVGGTGVAVGAAAGPAQATSSTTISRTLNVANRCFLVFMILLLKSSIDRPELARFPPGTGRASICVNRNANRASGSAKPRRWPVSVSSSEARQGWPAPPAHATARRSRQPGCLRHPFGQAYDGRVRPPHHLEGAIAFAELARVPVRICPNTNTAVPTTKKTVSPREANTPNWSKLPRRVKYPSEAADHTREEEGPAR